MVSKQFARRTQQRNIHTHWIHFNADGRHTQFTRSPIFMSRCSSFGIQRKGIFTISYRTDTHTHSQRLDLCVLLYIFYDFGWKFRYFRFVFVSNLFLSLSAWTESGSVFNSVETYVLRVPDGDSVRLRWPNKCLVFRFSSVRFSYAKYVNTSIIMGQAFDKGWLWDHSKNNTVYDVCDIRYLIESLLRIEVVH